MGLLASAGDCRDALAFQIDLSQQVIFRIGHVQHIAGQRHPLRMIELRDSEITIGSANSAGADDRQHFTIERGGHNAVMVAVGNEQPVALFIGQDFSWIPQRSWRGGIAFQFESQRLFIEQSFFAIIRQAVFEECIECGKFNFTAMRRHEVAFRIDDSQAGPAGAGVGIPDFVIGIVHDRMLDLISHDRLTNALRIMLGIELARVHANHYDIVRIRFLKLLELWQHVHAIDAAVRPEIEHDKLAAQIFEIDRARCVQPLGAAFQCRRGSSLRERMLRSSGLSGIHAAKDMSTRRSRPAKSR